MEKRLKVCLLGMSLILLASIFPIAKPFGALMNWVLWASFYASGIIIGVPVQYVIGKRALERNR